MSAGEMMLYIHIPFCKRKCLYCDFLSFVCDEKSQSSYMKALFAEMGFKGKKYKDRNITSVFIGGGTPSILSVSLLSQMLENIKTNFNIEENAEISMECNPGTLTEEKLLAIKKGGVNRLSLGLQSMDDNELKALGRIHSSEEFIRNFKLARKLGFNNINVDLMSSLPGQTVESFGQTLDKVLELEPEHISAYSLIVEEGTPFYDLYKDDVERRDKGKKTVSLPDDDTEYAISKLAESRLREAGYERYEVSNYARPGKNCRHNTGYWTRKEYLGLGLGSASLIENVRYKNLTGIDLYKRYWLEGNVAPEYEEAAWQNSAESKGYVEVQTLSTQDAIEETMFLGLRMTSGVDKAYFKEKFGKNIEDIYQAQIEKLKSEGLIEEDKNTIRMTDRGFDVGNMVFAEFL